MMKQARVLHKLTTLFAAGLMLSFTLIAMAQSGRRVTRSSSLPPVPMPTPEPKAVPKPSPEALAPLVTLIVGMDSATFSSVSLGASSGVLQSCADRLDDFPSVKVTAVNRNMGRGEAISKAKAGKDAHVVWLRVGSNSFSDQSSNLSDVYIEFTVYAPTTAKIVTSGRTYPGAYRIKTTIPTTRGGLYGDYLYNQAAREAAERILSAFKMSTRPIRLP